MRLAIPSSQLPLYSSLKDACRSDVQHRLTAMGEIRNAARKERATVIAKWASKLGMSAKRLQNLCSTFNGAAKHDPLGAWKTLVNTSKWPWPGEAGNLPPKTEQFIRQLLDTLPTAADARKVFLRRWRAWSQGDATQAIPGWETCPLDGGCGYPTGCSLRQFQRINATLSKWRGIAVKRGLKAVSGSLAHVASSRAETWPGAIIEMDDMWLNLKALHGRDAVRVVQFGAIDTHSGCLFHHGLKPRAIKADGTSTDLTEADFRFFLADVLLHHAGYDPERGTLIRLENAKTTLSEEAIRDLYNFTDGKLRVELAPMQGERPLVSGWWRGGGGGNPRFKPLIERIHEYIQRATAHLPGQVGRSVAELPEWVSDYHREVDLAVKARVSEEQWANLRLPFLEFHHLVPIVADIYRAVNERTEHRMEGWEKYLVREFRRADGLWIPGGEFEALPPADREQLRALVLANARKHTRERRLSPAEVWQRRRMVPIREELACLLIARDHVHADPLKAERTAAYGASFVVDGQRYEARVRERDGRMRELSHAERYQVIPFGTRAFIRDLDGCWIGSAQPIYGINPLDEEQYRRAVGHKAQRIADQLAPIREDHAAAAAQIAEDRSHNARIVAEAKAGPRPRKGRKVDLAAELAKQANRAPQGPAVTL